MSEKNSIMFLKILSSYFGKEMDNALIEIYLDYLTPHKIDYNLMMDLVVKNCDSFPSVKKLLNLYGIQDDFRLSDKSYKLINSTVSKVKKFGYMNYKSFKESATSSEIRLVNCMGGFERFCKIDMENPAIIKKCRDQAEYILQSADHNEYEKNVLLDKSLVTIKTIKGAIEK